jgi:hypothetical protein
MSVRESSKLIGIILLWSTFVVSSDLYKSIRSESRKNELGYLRTEYSKLNDALAQRLLAGGHS